MTDAQLATTFTHQALAVREALLKSTTARKRVLVLILNEKVRSEALAVRPEPNGTTLHAGSDGFSSQAFDRLRAMRAKLDPLTEQYFVEDRVACERLAKLSVSKLDAVIDVLTVECITAHMSRPTTLASLLARELEVNVRKFWRADGQWLSGFQKIQLAHLIAELRGAGACRYPRAEEVGVGRRAVQALH